MKKNIVLIGMMGCGKTTTGLELSKKLSDYKYVDIDEQIEKSTQKRISDIFLQKGENFFRLIETEKIKQLCNTNEKQIISTGGGAFEKEVNRNVLQNNGIVIYLKTSPNEIYERIKLETHRPLLRKNFNTENISKIIEQREKNYNKADIIILTDNKNPQEIAEEIIGAINDRNYSTN